MLGFTRLGLIQVSCLEKNKLIHASLDSVMAAEAKEKRAKRDIIISVILTGTLISLFFTRNIITFFPLFSFGLIIGIFEWIKLYKERRKKTMKRRRILRDIKNFLINLLLGGAKFRW